MDVVLAVAELLWHHAWRGGLRIGAGLLAGAIGGGVLILLLDRWLLGDESLKRRGWFGWARAGFLVFWLAVLPTTLAFAGAAVGLAFTAERMLDDLRLAERVTELAVGRLGEGLATVVEAQGTGQPYDRPFPDGSRAFLEGEGTLSIGAFEALVAALPERAVEVAGQEADELLSKEGEDNAEEALVRVLAGTLLDRLRSALEPKVGGESPRAALVAELRDRSPEGDPAIHLADVSRALAELYVEPGLARWIFWTLYLEEAVLIACLLVVAVAPGLLLKWAVAWRDRRAPLG